MNPYVTPLLASLERQSKVLWLTIGLMLMVVVVVGDYLTGYEVTFSLFYLAPILLLTWFVGRDVGLATAVVSAVLLLITDVQSGHLYSHPALYVWNMLISLGFFIITCLLLSALKKLLTEEQLKSRTDPLTGMVNRRYLFERAQFEIERSRRYGHPLTVAYVDLDDFKTVNDQWGHQAGDEVLMTIADGMKQHVRRTDTVARVGGDEFVILLPETEQAASQAVMEHIRHQLLSTMQQRCYPVTFSIGVLTCKTPPSSAEELVKRVDQLMYSVKRTGKNNTIYRTYPD